jgi:hypothetical protein
MLPAQESLASTKEKLLNALNARGLKEINGDKIPQNHLDIELGIPIDRNHLNRGWIGLDPMVVDGDDKPATNKGSKKDAPNSLQGANIRNGQAIAFRFKASSDGDDDGGDPGWDVVIPSLDDEPE